jgi:spore germination protein YaaH
MNRWMVLTLPLALACGISTGQSDHIGQADTLAVPARHTTVISDGCTLDGWQMATLSSPYAVHAVNEVVLLCLVPRTDGSVGPADPSSRGQLDELVATLHKLGYAVGLGASFVSENGSVFDGTETASKLLSAMWIDSVTTGIATAAHDADGVELDLEQLPPSAQAGVTSLVRSLATKIRPTRKVGVFLPPSDTTSAGAFDVAALAPSVDRFRVMTLDYSTTAGPVIDTGWAVDMVRAVVPNAQSTAVDVAFPLYGADYQNTTVRNLSYLEAIGLANTFHATPTRAASRDMYFDYTDDLSKSHEVWFDDTTSTLDALRAWDQNTLPLSVGVVLYGLGAEDPALLDALGRATP